MNGKFEITASNFGIGIWLILLMAVLSGIGIV
jgi:hypothetical protein